MISWTAARCCRGSPVAWRIYSLVGPSRKQTAARADRRADGTRVPRAGVARGRGRTERLPGLRHLAQAARLVRVAAALAGEAPGELLQRQDQEQRRKAIVGGFGDGEADGAERHCVGIAEH